jgi:pimeloyl-ACP methyl ester carboxylesterase
MPQITTPEGITLEYDTFGSPADPALLLVMGFGAQLIAWPRAFCERLAVGGRFVIRFDNRDCGLSSKLDGQGPDLSAIVAAATAGDLGAARTLSPYTLSDMSDDGFALLTGLGIERAHLVGSSMGGAIVQTMAIEHPERVLTLISMMSTTGEPEFGQSTPEALEALLAPPPADRDGYVLAATKNALIWGSKKYRDPAAAREHAARSYDRSYYPEGVGRQLAAMIASGSRADGLRSLQVPTLVIHGLDDTLVAPSGGERTAALVPGARLLLVRDMGHDRPEPLWPEISAAILEHTTAASLRWPYAS